MIEYQEFLGEKVNKLLLDMMGEIKKKNPMLEFTVGNNKATYFDENRDSKVIKMSLNVTELGDPSAVLGSLGCDADKKYWVRSRLIRNDKFSHWNKSQHESKTSKHMKNIIKEAVKYLKPLSYEEVKAEQEGGMDRKINDVQSLVHSKIGRNMRLDFIDMFPELLHMHNTGYTPATPKMAQVIAYAVESKEEIEKYYNYNPKKCMIWVRPNSVVYEIDKVVTQVNNTAELPEDLRGKLFVLDVTDKGQFVEGIGMKQDTGIYWVLLEEK